MTWFEARELVTVAPIAGVALLVAYTVSETGETGMVTKNVPWSSGLLDSGLDLCFLSVYRSDADSIVHLRCGDCNSTKPSKGDGLDGTHILRCRGV